MDDACSPVRSPHRGVWPWPHHALIVLLKEADERRLKERQAIIEARKRAEAKAREREVRR